MLKTREDQLAIYEKILREKLSVRQTEDLVKNLKSDMSYKPKKKPSSSFYKRKHLKILVQLFWTQNRHYRVSE